MRSRILVAGVLLALSMISTSAFACEIRKNEYGMWVGNCRLSDIFKEFEGVVRVGHPHSPLQLKLPNLLIDEFEFEFPFGGTEVWIYADVRNNGEYDSRSTSVVVMLDRINPLTGQMVGATQPMQATVPLLAPGTVQTIFLGIVNVPNRAQDWDLHLVGVVDPPTTVNPTIGNVWESDESDNTKQHLCRVYGPDPDFGVGACR